MATCPVPSHPTDHPIERRTFLRTLGGAVALSALPVTGLYGSAPDAAGTAQADGTIRVPFMDPVDVLICGSTLFACDLAVQAARAGRRTLLVMDRVNPFFEGISCLRAWLPAADAPQAPALLRGLLHNPAVTETLHGRTYFNAAKAALEIEDQLIEAGVRFLYNAAVAGAVGESGRLSGVVFGGKTGLFAVEAAAVVDATPEATVARAAGARFTPVTGPRHCHYVADLAKAVAPRQRTFTATGGIPVSAELHHWYATFDVTLDDRSRGPFALAEDYARLYAAVLEFPWEDGERRFRGADAFLTSGLDRLELSGPATAAGIASLLVFGPAGIPGNTAGSLVLRDPLALFRAFPDPLARIAAAGRPPGSPAAERSFLNHGVPADPAPAGGREHRFHDHGFAEPGLTPGTLRFTPPATATRAAVIVAGGGTSGNAAAFTCASLGLDTLCLERGPELGGTNTLGGVTNLWYGNKTRGFEDYYRAMNARNDGLNAPGFFRGVTGTGARVLFQAVLTGVERTGRDVSRTYVITPFGLTAVAAARWIDATGDGSIAAWAGCGYTFGGEHDELTLWASFANFLPGKQEALRPFLSPCDERSAVDTTRFVLSMRRNGKTSVDVKHLHPPFFIAPRESRHIRGGRTVTFLDVLAGRRFRHGVFRIESNPDIKGLATSDAAVAGFIPVDWRTLYQVTVPYDAMVPGAVDNVLIAGKAYSVTHDALSAARMQRDLCVMGIAAAHAVRLAIDRRTLLRGIPVPELQRTLISRGLLQATDIAEDDLGFGASAEELVRTVLTATNMDACLPASAQLCLLPRERILELLEPHAGTYTYGLDRVLAFLGHPLARQRHLERLDKALAEPELSRELYGGKATGHLMPDQGYAPTAVLRLGALALARDQRAVPRLVRLAGRVNFDPKELRSSWGYFHGLASGFERLPAPEGQAPLRQVLSNPLFARRTVERDGDLRAARDTALERFTYLRLSLARALLRCGDPEGGAVLCDFLNEARVCFARAARAELVAATGRDFGFRPVEWRAWLKAHAAELKPNPLTQAFG